MKAQNFSQTYGPWAIVTGASSGIGEEFARQLAAIGLNLVLVARRKSRLDELGQKLKQQFAIQTRSVQADLSQAEGIAAVETATADLEIGLLVSNAGTALAGAFLKLDPDAAARMIHLNATAHMRLSHFFGQKMTQRGRGGIIFVSSIGAIQGMPYLANYSAAKAYILNLGESLYFELKPKGVDVTVLLPGATDTEAKNWEGAGDMSKMPMPWMGAESVVANALKALGKRPSTIPGTFNKVMSFVNRRVMSRASAASLFGNMMSRTIAPERL